MSRDLGNHPGNIATPSRLEAEAREIAKNENFNIKVFDRKEFTEMGMGDLPEFLKEQTNHLNLLLLNTSMEKRMKNLK